MAIRDTLKMGKNGTVPFLGKRQVLKSWSHRMGRRNVWHLYSIHHTKNGHVTGARRSALAQNILLTLDYLSTRNPLRISLAVTPTQEAKL